MEKQETDLFHLTSLPQPHNDMSDRRPKMTFADYDWGEEQLLGKSRCTKCAEVVRVRRKRDGKVVAVRKMSSPLNPHPPPDAVEAYEEMQRILKLPFHNHLVPINSIFRDKDFTYVEMDYHEGTLNSKIQRKFELRGAFSQSQIVRYMLQLVQAVRFLHAHSILHRDLRPKNIYIMDHDDSIRLGDYGAPKLYQNRSHGSRFAGAHWWAENHYNAGPSHCCMSPVSAWPYMPPELMCELFRPKTAANTHARGKHGDRYNILSEAWCIGVILYEMLTLRVPFQGRTPKQVQKAIINANLPFQEVPTVRKYSEKISKLAMQLLCDVPDERISLAEVEQQLAPLSLRSEVLNLAKMGQVDELDNLLKTSSSLRLVDVRDSKGFTPLMIAAALGHTDVVSLLMRNGADTRVKSKSGWTLDDCIDDDHADDPDMQFVLHEITTTTSFRGNNEPMRR